MIERPFRKTALTTPRLVEQGVRVIAHDEPFIRTAPGMCRCTVCGKAVMNKHNLRQNHLASDYHKKRLRNED